MYLVEMLNRCATTYLAVLYSGCFIFVAGFSPLNIATKKGFQLFAVSNTQGQKSPIPEVKLSELDQRRIFQVNNQINAYAKDAQWEKALEVLEELKETGPAPNVVSYNNAISALANGKQKRRALALFQELKEVTNPNMYSYGAIINACAKKSRL
mmetsp:Transcript_12954/g.17050  ORF Transcript_12954/g.17050 Transcript_12954/m.17050 type:complete len:154 (-) Transcript_12954:1-462(-)